jgi:hypothetical protein
MDLALDAALDGHQQETQAGGDVHRALSQANVAVDSAAFEVQRVAFPTPVDVELLGNVVGDALHGGLCFRGRTIVLAANVDGGHGGNPSGAALADILAAFPGRHQYAPARLC